MMNLIIDELPTSVSVDGEDYYINFDFRIGVMFEQLMLDKSIDQEDKLFHALHLYYGDDIPRNVDEAVAALMWFYHCGEDDDSVAKRAHKAAEKRLYDYDFDAPYIYSAFMEQYGIDLQDTSLHWWKFRAMFKSLRDDTEFRKIMGYRAVQITSSMTQSQKDFYNKMKQEYALPVSRDEAQKNQDIADALMNGGDLSKLLGGG